MTLANPNRDSAQTHKWQRLKEIERRKIKDRPFGARKQPGEEDGEDGLNANGSVLISVSIVCVPFIDVAGFVTTE